MRAIRTLLGKILLIVVIPVIVVVIGTTIHERLVSTSSIEYRVSTVGPLFYCPQGLENRVHVDLDGKPYKNLSMIRLELFNRSTKSFSDVPIQIHLRQGTATLLGKLLIYPAEQDRDYFVWNDTKPTSLDVTARALNTTWTSQPCVTFNLFFDDGKLPDVLLSTSKAGIVFVPLEESKLFLFPYDFVVLIAAVVCLALYGLVQIGLANQRSKAAAFGRVFATLYAKEVEGAKEIAVTTAKEISGTKVRQAAAAAYTVNLQRARYGPRGDRAAVAAAEAILATLREAEAKGTPEVVAG